MGLSVTMLEIVRVSDRWHPSRAFLSTSVQIRSMAGFVVNRRSKQRNPSNWLQFTCTRGSISGIRRYSVITQQAKAKQTRGAGHSVSSEASASACAVIRRPLTPNLVLAIVQRVSRIPQPNRSREPLRPSMGWRGPYPEVEWDLGRLMPPLAYDVHTGRNAASVSCVHPTKQPYACLPGQRTETGGH